MDTKLFTLAIDIIGVATAILSLIIIINASRKIGGQIGSSFNLILWGILLQMSAIIYTIIFTRLKILPAPPIDIHHGLMVIGLVFFVVAAKKFSDLSQ